MNDPYNKFICVIREEGAFLNEPSFIVGEIVEGLPDLKVKTGDNIIDKDSLLIDKWILDRNSALFTKLSTCDIQHNHEIDGPIKDSLNKGDLVVMIRHGENLVILSKVVNV